VGVHCGWWLFSYIGPLICYLTVLERALGVSLDGLMGLLYGIELGLANR
jgi:hypothetical protein